MKKSTPLITILCFFVFCTAVSCNPYSGPVRYKTQKQKKYTPVKSNVKVKTYNKKKYVPVNAKDVSY